ncbi:RusA family crossover junction endodeoxyribonuclease [Paenibacillus sp. TRM 82003]|nr:RusA family crossover junction endodeoxyribonuclease [Paenibacillus sp. TRM 82003]
MEEGEGMIPVERIPSKRITCVVEPMGAVRMTQRGKFKSPSAQRYIAWKTRIGWWLKKQWADPTEAAVGVKVTFYMPIPQSLSQKKQREMNGTYHTKKPDIDNLVKALFDGANGIIWRDDNQVVRVETEKRYSDDPRIELIVEEVS